MNKKFTGMAAVFILAAALTACGGNSNENAGKATGTPAVTQTPSVTVLPEVTLAPESSEDPAATANPDGGLTEGDNVSKDLFDKSISGLELPSLADMPEDMFVDSYGLDTGLFQSYTVQMPLMNVQATEVGVFQVKDKADIETVKKGIEKRAAALQETWKTYLPEQYELVQQYKIEEKGDFILFVIAKDANTIIINFMNAIK